MCTELLVVLRHAIANLGEVVSDYAGPRAKRRPTKRSRESRQECGTRQIQWTSIISPVNSQNAITRTRRTGNKLCARAYFAAARFSNWAICCFSRSALGPGGT